MVTARPEQVDFHVPVRKGQMVELVATVVSVGRTSMKVDVAMFTEESHPRPRTLHARHLHDDRPGQRLEAYSGRFLPELIVSPEQVSSTGLT